MSSRLYKILELSDGGEDIFLCFFSFYLLVNIHNLMRMYNLWWTYLSRYDLKDIIIQDQS
jgi:hypothetical protein